MNNALLYLGGLLVVVLTALLAVPMFIDWNGYRGVFEEEASKVLGRDVRVGGGVALRILPTPYVRFEKVRLADPTGQTGEPFVRAESFTMWLSGPALLRGVLEANEVELTRPTLTLALDGKGSGNWASLELKPASLPFVPKDVTLKSVKLIDGTLSLYNPDAQLVGKIVSVNGELAADALDGPFKFKGTAGWAGEDHEIKIVTDKPDAEGGIRLKANSRSVKSTNSYTVDGKIVQLSSAPKFAGELTAKLAALNADVSAANAEPVGMDFKSAITADATGAKFDDILLSLENSAEPQTVSGHATATWAAAPKLDIALSSKWINLDRIAGSGEEAATLPRIKHVVLSIMHALSGDGAASVQLDVEQIKMGGETAGGLKLDAERHGSDIHIRKFEAGLPGGSRLSADGYLKDDAGKATFAGSGFVHGINVARLISWAAKSGAAIDLKAEGPFSIAGQIVLSDAGFELREAVAELNGRSLSGEVALLDGSQRKVIVSLESAKIDTSEIFPGAVRQVEAQIREAFGFSPNGVSAPEATEKGNSADDIELKLLAGELKHGSRVYKDVDARLSLTGGNIRVTHANFATGSGLVVGIEGQVLKAENAGRGTLAYELEAKSAAAAQDISNVFGLSDIVSPERLAALAPAQIAGLVHLGKRGESAADISVDGVLNSAQVSGQAIFDSGFGAWRTAPSSASFKIKAADPSAISNLLGLPIKQQPNAEARPAEVVVASSGALSTGAAALVAVKAAGLEANFGGRATWPEGRSIDLSGPLTVKARDLQELVALAGAKLPGGAAGTAVEGQIDIAGASGAWSASSRQLVIGNATLSGNVSLTSNAKGPSKIAGTISADRLTVTGLLGGILDKPLVVSQVAVTDQQAAGTANWPESVFNFTSLKTLEGSVDVKFAELGAGGTLVVRDGALKIAVAPDHVELADISGKALGGSVLAAAKLETVGGGTGVSATLKIDAAEMAQLSPRASGKASLVASVSSRAQSPAGLIASLSGTGSLALESVTLPGLAPRAVTVAANTILQNKTSNNASAVQEAVQLSLAGSTVPLGTRKVGVVIADGAVKVDPMSLETPDGTATITTTADLMSLRLDSQWRVSALVTPLPPPTDVGPNWIAPPTKGPLPPASVVYTGRLDNPRMLVASVDTAELQREMTVRQMERNVEELERLRKRDEELARREAERRKAIEAERAAAAAAAAAAKAQPNKSPPAGPPDAAAPPPPPGLPNSSGAAATPPAVLPNSSGTAATPPAVPEANTGGTVTVVPLSVEPIPPPATAEVVPPPGPRIAPRPQPAKRPSSSRTSVDDVKRALGGAP